MTQVRGLLELKFCSVGKNCDSTALNFSPALKGNKQMNKEPLSVNKLYLRLAICVLFVYNKNVSLSKQIH